ncbi:HEXXH motif domain-containing protein [Sphaerisporangium sp. B11E5]|uniref:HEXXH motif domain-containing protein n=1 Tax=Sphaerisporangium sp. B11E5 TaxID=3153563 RepID=UPI00325D0C88
MNTRRHTMAAGLFDRIAAGEGGGRALRALSTAEYSKRLLLLRTVVTEATARSHPQADIARRAYATLADLQRRAPRAVREVLAYPGVGALTVTVLRGLTSGGRRPGGEPGPHREPRAGTRPDPYAAPPADPGVGPEWLASVAAAAAVRARVPMSVPVRVHGRGVVLPSLGLAEFPGAADGQEAIVLAGGAGAAVATGDQVVRVPEDPHAESGPWLGLRRLVVGTGRDTLTLLVDDVDPMRFPLRDRCAPRLSREDLAAWREMLAPAWRLLVRAHPGVAAETAAGVTVLVPLRAPSGGTSSATSPAAFGSVAISLPPDPVTTAQSFAHEVQHAKLSALGTLFPMIDDEGDDLFYAPWRDDPRPLGALLQGAYAHLGIATFWSRQAGVTRTPEALLHAQTQLARWRQATWEVAGTLLDTGRLTPPGRRFTTGMRRSLAALRAQPVPATAATRATRMATAHHTRYLARTGEP